MFAQVLITEFSKIRRSKVPWGTLGGLSMAPLGLALFMWIVREPGRAAELGLLGAKANLSGLEATGPAYLATLAIVFGVGGMLLLPFIVAFLFGREYVELTAKNMLALPVARHLFVLAKLAVAAVWWFALVVIVLAEGLVIGLLLGLPHFIGVLVEWALMLLGDTRLRKSLVIGGGLVVVLALVLIGGGTSFAMLLAGMVLSFPASGAFVTLAQAALMDIHSGREPHMMARWTVLLPPSRSRSAARSSKTPSRRGGPGRRRP